MLKSQPAAVSAPRSGMNTRSLAACALLAAISIVLARLIIPMPNESTRFSIEAVPIFIAGMLFGPLPGALVGFVADFVGCLFSGYGFNPLFCLPPILYGLCAGLFRPLLMKKVTPWAIALAFFPAIVFGSVLYQSWALSFVYGGEAFLAYFLTKLTTRSIQFAITYVLDVAVVYLLYKSKVFTAVRLWPPVCAKSEKDN